MTTALPDRGSSSAEDHAAMSHRFLEHAKIEVDQGNRLQSPEKVWGAVAHASSPSGRNAAGTTATTRTLRTSAIT